METLPYGRPQGIAPTILILNRIILNEEFDFIRKIMGGRRDPPLQ
jgi:hypothetical protein